MGCLDITACSQILPWIPISLKSSHNVEEALHELPFLPPLTAPDLVSCSIPCSFLEAPWSPHKSWNHPGHTHTSGCLHQLLSPWKALPSDAHRTLPHLSPVFTQTFLFRWGLPGPSKISPHLHHISTKYVHFVSSFPAWHGHFTYHYLRTSLTKTAGICVCSSLYPLCPAQSLTVEPPAQAGCMRQVLGPGALGRPRGIGWRGRWEEGSGWGIHVTPWLIHVNVWQNPLQDCKVISLQLIKINEKKWQD